MDEITVKGVSHITGGGFYENIPRSLKKGCAARIAKADVRTPALFEVMQREGGITEHDMFNTFNKMGIRDRNGVDARTTRNSESMEDM